MYARAIEAVCPHAARLQRSGFDRCDLERCALNGTRPQRNGCYDDVPIAVRAARGQGES